MGRQIDLASRWRFHYGECENAWYKGYNDSAWEAIRIPHDWSVSMPFSKEHSSGTGYLPGGIGWYRLHFRLPKEDQGKHVELIFDGVYKNSQVWVNSYYLGRRPNGYIGFHYDISDRLVYGDEDNVICVKVVHTDIADSRWFTGSGITRMVRLNIEEQVHPEYESLIFSSQVQGIDAIDALDDIKGMDGDAHIDHISAKVQLRQNIINSSRIDQHMQVVMRLYDAQGKLVLEAEKRIYCCAGDKSSYVIESILENPNLWSPDEPYLYSLQICYRIEQENSQEYSVTKEAVGIRDMRFDPDQGFFLNGKQTIIKGVCLHHDGGCLGAAMTKEVWQRRLELLKEVGCNAIRCSHNPHMPELYDLCDHMGFLVMEEAFDEWENPKNKWSTGHNVYPPKHEGYAEAFPMWHEADLRAMVRRGRNHPSIFAWSIGNEIDYPNDPYCHPLFNEMTGNNDANKPSAERQYDPNKPNAERLITIGNALARIVREEDSTRPVTLAAAFPELSTQLGLMDMVDLAGYNYKEHLYEEDHKRFPHKPIIGSENSHSYEAWRAVVDHPYISGQFLWTGIDYLGEARGWPIYGSGAGMISTAGFIKPRYERRRTYWLDETAVYISTKPVEGDKALAHEDYFHWNYVPGQRVEVSCYWSLSIKKGYVKLYCNDRCIGERALGLSLVNNEIEKMQTEAKITHDAYGFTCILPFEAGRLHAVLYDEEGNEVAFKRIETTGPVDHLSYKVYSGKDRMTGMDDRERAEQSGYIYQIEVDVEDEQNRCVPSDELWIKAQVTGSGMLLGIDNGNLSDLTPYASNERKCYQGKAVIYVRREKPGDIALVIDGQEAGVYTIHFI